VEGNFENSSTTEAVEPLSPKGRPRHLVITKAPEVPASNNETEEILDNKEDKLKDKPAVKDGKEVLMLSRESAVGQQTDKSDSPTNSAWLSVRATTPGVLRGDPSIHSPPVKPESRATPKKALPPAPTAKSTRVNPVYTKNPSGDAKKTPWTTTTPSAHSPPEEKHS